MGKFADTLAKTWRRMSDHGHQQALKLDLRPEVVGLLERGLARLPASPGGPQSPRPAC